MAIKINQQNVNVINFEDNDVKVVKVNGQVRWCKPFSLSINVDQGVSDIVITRISTSEPTATLGRVYSSTKLYYNDVIQVNYSIDVGSTFDSFNISGVELLGTAFIRYRVIDDVSIRIETERKTWITTIKIPSRNSLEYYDQAQVGNISYRYVFFPERENDEDRPYYIRSSQPNIKHYLNFNSRHVITDLDYAETVQVFPNAIMSWRDYYNQMLRIENVETFEIAYKPVLLTYQNAKSKTAELALYPSGDNVMNDTNRIEIDFTFPQQSYTNELIIWYVDNASGTMSQLYTVARPLEHNGITLSIDDIAITDIQHLSGAFTGPTRYRFTVSSNRLSNRAAKFTIYPRYYVAWTIS